jgi:hypothetical protein
LGRRLVGCREAEVGESGGDLDDCTAHFEVEVGGGGDVLCDADAVSP